MIPLVPPTPSLVPHLPGNLSWAGQLFKEIFWMQTTSIFSLFGRNYLSVYQLERKAFLFLWRKMEVVSIHSEVCD